MHSSLQRNFSNPNSLVLQRKEFALSMSTRLSHPLLRLILVFMLALTFALPKTAFAASTVQPTDEAVAVAYYESEELTFEDAEGVVVDLYLYDDNTFELEIYFPDDEEPSVAYGDYAESDEGVTLTLVGADNEDFDEPSDLELTYDADDSLVIP